jgi:precorrin-6x reductase
MSWSNCTPEDYSAWRHEQIVEAANLARFLSYNDFADWRQREDIQAVVGSTRPFASEGTVTGLARQAGRVITQALARLRLGFQMP